LITGAWQVHVENQEFFDWCLEERGVKQLIFLQLDWRRAYFLKGKASFLEPAFPMTAYGL
jgi:hypothetical protein